MESRTGIGDGVLSAELIARLARPPSADPEPTVTARHPRSCICTVGVMCSGRPA